MKPTNVHIISLSPPATNDFPEEWYAIAGEDHFWLEWRIRAFESLLNKIRYPINDPLLVLDVGCGHGAVRRQLESRTRWIIDGCDLNKSGLQRNDTKTGSTMLYNVNDRLLDFKEKYDAILLFDIIEHIAHEKSFIESALFHLKPGGVLFINVPAINSMMSTYDKAAGHLRRYDKPMIRALFRECPATVLDMRYWGFSLLPLVFLRKLLYAGSNANEQIIRKGFAPPGEIFNAILKGVMTMETAICHNPSVGASLLVAVKKNPNK